MATSNSAYLAEEQRRATFLELFFDLVFVFAITRLAAFVHEGADLTVYLRAALIFAIVWWSWSQFTWMANAVDTGDRRVRLIMLLATGTAFFMAQALTDVYSDAAEWFTVPYTITLLLGIGLYWWGLRGDPAHQRALRTYVPVAVPGALIVGLAGFLPESGRSLAFIVALALFALSGVTAARGDLFRISPGHFAERHGLIVIIALGESIIAVGVASAGLDRTVETISTMVLGVVGAIALWWAYFDWFNVFVEGRLEASPEESRAQLARDNYTFGHYPLVFAIVCFAIAVEEAVTHPDEPLGNIARFALAASVPLFLAMIVAIYLRAGGILLVERFAGAITALIVIVAFPDLDAVQAVLIVIAILITSLAIEQLRDHAGMLRQVRHRNS